MGCQGNDVIDVNSNCNSAVFAISFLESSKCKLFLFDLTKNLSPEETICLIFFHQITNIKYNIKKQEMDLIFHVLKTGQKPERFNSL